MRELLDYVDRHKGEDGISMRDQTTALLGATQAIEQNVPSHLNNDLTPTQVGRKLTKVLSIAGLSNADLSSEGILSEDSSIRNLWRFGTQMLDLLKLPPGIYTEEELEPSRERRRSKMANAKQQRAGRPVTKNAKSVDNPPSAPDLSSLRASVNTALVKDSPNIKHIQEVMDDIRKDIEVAVMQRLRDSGTSSTLPVALNIGLLRHDLRNLIATLLGCDASMVQHELSRRSFVYTQQRLQMDTFIRALIGAAVTHWVWSRCCTISRMQGIGRLWRRCTMVSAD